MTYTNISFLLVKIRYISTLLRIYIQTLTPQGEAHCSWLCINKLSLTHQRGFGLKYPYSPSLKGGYSSVVNKNT